MVVKKKILPEYYRAVADGDKNFELRKDEDNIKVGDILRLLEYDKKGATGYTGRAIERNVKYVLRNVPEYGLQDGYCIIGW